MDRLFKPQRIAVVGASANEDAIGGKPIKQLKSHGFKGEIFPVNPNRDTIQGIPCSPSVSALPEGIDLAIIAVAAPRVAAVIAECGERGIPFAAVISSGFADAGGDGAVLQEQLLEVAAQANVSILGPNNVGFINMGASVYAGFGAFFDYNFNAGPVGFVTQSGGVGGSLLTVADEEGIDFGYFVHTGNAADIDIEGVLGHFLTDPDINTMVAYVEGLGDDAQLKSIAYSALAADKPLLVWKAGQYASSMSAVVSHTGRLAGDIDRYRAIFDKYGVVEVNDTSDMVDVLRLAQRSYRPAGGRIGVVSVSGGAGVVAADYLEGSANLSLADLGEETVGKIAAMLPTFATARNPIDVTAQIFNEPDLFERVVSVLQENSAVDQILACVASVHSAVGVQIAEAIVVAAETLKLPIVVSWAARDSLNAEAFKLLKNANIPVFRSPERALKAMDSMTSFTNAQAGLPSLLDPAAASGTAEGEKRGWARSVEFDVLNALAGYGVTIPAQRLAATAEEAAAAAEAVGYPVAVKIQSPDIPHKVAAGGVRLRLKNAAEVADGTTEIFDAVATLGAIESRGVVVQNMAAPGTELILGYIRDAALGGFILCGQGGSDVEAVSDRVLIPTPATPAEILAGLESLRVLKETKASGAELEKVVGVMVALQRLVSDSTGALQEVEINPVIISAGNVTAVDALAVQA
ncbi:acetate--CoA ligase family protein [Arthrobacter sp. 35W]|uniref:acetate--CoA ligase family protein n=1 Tax=Arthrobacter sp. 35W TaxID=1132441 RepID=UPI0003FE2858|nr:acetate--CoA ligase family protein [Arthrobacter sp. 35W]